MKYCEDCCRIVSPDGYPYHNADHSFVEYYYYQKSDVDKLFFGGKK